MVDVGSVSAHVCGRPHMSVVESTPVATTVSKILEDEHTGTLRHDSMSFIATP